jgi:creatinine amidohydrolase/Fe(II)-dependent formamide hydrolase-like protein
MKPPTVFLGEMTNSEVEQFLKQHHTVIVPVGSTEQHGPHLALTADVLIPQEVARRVAPKVGAVVAPPVNYALSYPHVGFRGHREDVPGDAAALRRPACPVMMSPAFREPVWEAAWARRSWSSW